MPVGAKGGFVPKALPACDREAIQAEGVASYRTFVSALLDITDDMAPTSIVGPPEVVRYARRQTRYDALRPALARPFTVSTINLFGWRVNFLDPVNKYYVILAFVAVALWFVSRVLNSYFGAVIEAIRENEARARACGYYVEGTKLLSFVLSGIVSGLSGTLSALHLTIVPLDTLHYQTSGLVVMMTLLGGAGSFFGPFVGAFAFLLMEDVFSQWTPHWQLIVGAIFILFVLFLPKGIWGTLLTMRGGQ